MKKHLNEFWYLYMCLMLSALNILIGFQHFNYVSAFNFLGAGFTIGCGIIVTWWKRSNKWRDEAITKYRNLAHAQLEIMEFQHNDLLKLKKEIKKFTIKQN